MKNVISLKKQNISGQVYWKCRPKCFLMSIASQKIFRPVFPEIETRILFLCLFYFLIHFSGHFRQDFVVLLLLFTAGSRRTRKADQKHPEMQDKKNKRDMKNISGAHCEKDSIYQNLKIVEQNGGNITYLPSSSLSS